MNAVDPVIFLSGLAMGLFAANSTIGLWFRLKKAEEAFTAKANKDAIYATNFRDQVTQIAATNSLENSLKAEARITELIKQLPKRDSQILLAEMGKSSPTGRRNYVIKLAESISSADRELVRN